MIYVMGERRIGVVKIGRAINPVERLKQVQTGYPMPLRLQLALPGDRAEEAWLHRRFASIRMSEREWFDFRETDAVEAVAVALGLYEADPSIDPHADTDAPPAPIENPRRRRVETLDEDSLFERHGKPGFPVFVTDDAGDVDTVGDLVSWRLDTDGCWVGWTRTRTRRGGTAWEWIGAEALMPMTAAT